jgi:hypothetical protein
VSPELQTWLLQQMIDKGIGIVATAIGSVLGWLILRQAKRALGVANEAREQVRQMTVSQLDAASLQGWTRSVDQRLAELAERPAARPHPGGHLAPPRPRRSSMSTNTIPQVLDPFVRTVRTGIQVLAAFVTIAPAVPVIVATIHADDGSRVGIVLAAAAVWVTTAAGVIARIMAIPAVNDLLAHWNLAGHSGEYAGGGDTFTSMLTLPAGAQTDSLR